ncbi:MAG: hypothetical protein AB1847_08630 [bacterium]
MKHFFKTVIVTCLISLSFLFFVTLASGYYGSPLEGQPYSTHSQQASSAAINININIPPDSTPPINININVNESKPSESSPAGYGTYPGYLYSGSPTGLYGGVYGSIYGSFPAGGLYGGYPSVNGVYGSYAAYPYGGSPTGLYGGVYGSSLYGGYPSVGGVYGGYTAYPYGGSPTGLYGGVYGSYTAYPYSGSSSGEYDRYPASYGGYPSGSAAALPPWFPYASGMMAGTDMYGNEWITYLPPTAASIRAATAKFGLMYSAMDGDYTYVTFSENGGQNRGGLAIFETSDSGEYKYLSHVVLAEGGGGYDNRLGVPPLPGKIIVQDDLAVIGGNDLGVVYLVDVSDKEKPVRINTLKLAGDDDNGADHILGLAIEGQVLFVGIEDLDGTDLDSAGTTYTVFALDISDPENMDESASLLDSYEFESDYKVYSIASAPGYLYLPGKKCTEEDYGLTIHILNTSDPKNLSLVHIFNELGTAPAHEPELSITAAMKPDGDYLLATVEASEEFGPFATAAYKLKIIDISDPINPKIVSSSGKLDGDQILGNEKDMVVKDHYAYVLATTRMPSKTKIDVFDIKDPNTPEIVDTSESVTGLGLGLYLSGDNKLCLHAGMNLAVFDISDPKNIFLVRTVDLEQMLEEELADWGQGADSLVYQSPYGPISTGMGYPPPVPYPAGQYIGYGSAGLVNPYQVTPAGGGLYGLGGTGLAGAQATSPVYGGNVSGAYSPYPSSSSPTGSYSSPAGLSIPGGVAYPQYPAAYLPYGSSLPAEVIAPPSSSSQAPLLVPSGYTPPPSSNSQYGYPLTSN